MKGANVYKMVAVPDFPKYSVCEEGFVVHNETRKRLTIFKNNTGVCYVSLTQGGKTASRSLPKLVANAFLPTPELPSFDTPINLNGDRFDNRASNLAWRPLWFAAKYHRQFREQGHSLHKTMVVVEETGDILSCWDFATEYGVLARSVFLCAISQNPREKRIWPYDLTIQLHINAA